jgi:hypothetical protein
MKKFQISKLAICFAFVLFFVNPVPAYSQNFFYTEETGLRLLIHSELDSGEESGLSTPPPIFPEAPLEQWNQWEQYDQWSCQEFPACGSWEDSTFRLFRGGSRLKLSGWVEAGLYAHAHGATSKYGPNGEGLLSNSGNGQLFGPGRRTTNFNMSQLWGRLIREMDCENGLDWGFQADMVYGMDGYDIQTGNDSFDSGWGSGDYGLGFHQLYGEMGYKKLSVIFGKFGTPIGWEDTLAWNNYFYSFSSAGSIEPCTHTGAVFYYQLTDGLKLAGGWATGMENSFANPFGDKSLIAGFELAFTKKSTIYYYMTKGRMNVPSSGNARSFFLPYQQTTNHFIQSLCFEWLLTEKLTYVLEYNLNNSNDVGGDRRSAYGINNHLTYRLHEKWGVGLRAEWLQDNGILEYEDAKGVSNHSDYVELTLSLNFFPTERLHLRSEIRYDHAYKNPIFAYGTKNEQFSGGFAILYGF